MHQTAQSGVTALQIVTLIISVLALVTSVGVLTWQVLSWRLTGSVVKVDLLGGYLVQGGVASGPLDEFRLPTHQRITRDDLVFAVRARNVGRTPVNVTSWGVAVGGGFTFSRLGGPLNPSMPHRLEPGSSVDFYVESEMIARAVHAGAAIGNHSNQLRATATLATGRTIKGDEHQAPAWLIRTFPDQPSAS